MRSRISRLVIIPLFSVTLWAQGLDTRATRDDWEEINFEFNSSVLVDGYPSLLRLAELLQTNAGYRVLIEGHTDSVGANPANDQLGLARANTVRDFLTKYGARANQITTATRGETAARAPATSPPASTDEARWMDRRVVLTVTDEQGRTISAGGAGDAIRAITPAPQQTPDSSAEILRRLEKLDTIERLIGELSQQNTQLRTEVTALRQTQETLRQTQDTLRQTQDTVRLSQQSIETRIANAPVPPTTAQVATAVTEEIERNKLPKFQLLGVNVGADDDADFTFTGKGRYFAPFGDRYGFQAQGEYFYSNGQREGQFDVGLVDRIGSFQAGLFSSFKHVNLTRDSSGGTLGQGSLTLDYLTNWGSIGVYGTKSFLSDSLLSRTATGNSITERYLRAVDHTGINLTGPLFRRNYFEANAGYLWNRTVADRAGGTLRLIFPIADKVAITAEGGINETFSGSSSTGRAVFGLQFGRVLRPGELKAAAHAVPVQVPRVRYEVFARTVRVSNGTPVADAGPNQNLPGAATVTLNGSNSFDPDGDSLTFQWTQEAGPPVTLSNPTTAVATFPAAAGQTYSFRLTVRDAGGAQSAARITITTAAPPQAPPAIISFTASPNPITFGQSSTLSWQVTNADNVVISTIGNVPVNGSTPVSPQATTTYVLTATRGLQTATASVTVTVNIPSPVITTFTANPAMPMAGAATALTCTAENAVRIILDSRVFQAPNATVTVHPMMSTTYTCIAVGVNGTTVERELAVMVTGGGGVD